MLEDEGTGVVLFISSTSALGGEFVPFKLIIHLQNYCLLRDLATKRAYLSLSTRNHGQLTSELPGVNGLKYHLCLLEREDY